MPEADGLVKYIYANLSLGRPANIRLTQGGFSVATADFNGDGFADLLVDDGGAQPAQVFLGDGNGDFQLVPSPVSGSRMDFTGYRFQIADFNGDGIPDLSFASSVGHAVYLAIGDGTGHFKITQTVLLTPYDRLIALALGDFNHDGSPDLVAVSSSSGTSPGALTALLNDGTGKFTQLAQPITSVQSAENIAAADFDGDGNLDLAIGTDGNTTRLLFGNGKGGFDPRSGFVLRNTFYLLAADINADGRPDLLALSTAVPGEDVYLGALMYPSVQLTEEPDNPFTFRQSVTVDLTIAPLPQSFAPFTGTVSVFDGSILLGTVALTSPTTRFTAPFQAGRHQFHAVYGGQTEYTLTIIETGPPAAIAAVIDPVNGRTSGVIVTDAEADPISGAGVIFTAPTFDPVLIRTDIAGIAAAPNFVPNGYPITATVSGYPALSFTYQRQN